MLFYFAQGFKSGSVLLSSSTCYQATRGGEAAERRCSPIRDSLIRAGNCLPASRVTQCLNVKCVSGSVRPPCAAPSGTPCHYFSGYLNRNSTLDALFLLFTFSLSHFEAHSVSVTKKETGNLFGFKSIFMCGRIEAEASTGFSSR